MANATLLAVAVGNSETFLGMFEGGELLAPWSVSTNDSATSNELELAVHAFADARGLPLPADAIVCSVVPALTDAWMRTLRVLTGARPLVVGPGIKSGMRIGYKDPAQMGADRVAMAVAAREQMGVPVIVADFGTTTTLTVVDGQGTLLGGVIAPGMRASLDALCSSAAQLADTGMQVPRAVIGRSTAEAMRSGLLFGEAARIDGLVDAIWRELGCQTRLAATGAHAAIACSLSRHDFAVRDALVLEGLQILHRLNRMD